MILFLLLWALFQGGAKAAIHSWDTVGHQSFFHSSNISGGYAADALQLISKFPVATIEKYQNYQQEPEEEAISSTLRAIKAFNPDVTTIFYYNSVCAFPQYSELQQKLSGADFLRLENGSYARLNCALQRGLKVYNLASEKVRQLWKAACLNSGADGCFVDRAVNGMQIANLNLTSSTRTAYLKGHTQAINELQQKLGAGFVIANHAYGPPPRFFTHELSATRSL